MRVSDVGVECCCSLPDPQSANIRLDVRPRPGMGGVQNRPGPRDLQGTVSEMGWVIKLGLF